MTEVNPACSGRQTASPEVTSSSVPDLAAEPASSRFSLPSDLSTAWIPPSARHLLLPLGAAVCLALFGDLTLYAVLATEREVVGLSLGAVGVMLAANRLIRIPGNPIVGTLFDRRGRRWLFILGMVLGVLSTAAYGIVRGAVPFLVARLVWGIAWMLINIGGTTMILDVTTAANRGRLVGIYNAWMLGGFAAGPLVGGFLVDGLGFRSAMLICAACTAAGLLLALLRLPETVPVSRHTMTARAGSTDPARRGMALWRDGIRIYLDNPRLLTAALLHLLVLFVGEGIALSTLNLWLQERLGVTVTVRGLVVGIAAASGFLAGARALVAGLVGPLAGKLSDKTQRRGAIVAAGMLVSAVGLAWLAFTASPLSILMAVLLSALGDGTVRATLTATLGDAAPAAKTGLVLGFYVTIGDVGSTLGPVLAFALLPVVGLQQLYIVCAVVFSVGMGLIWWYQKRRNGRPGP